MSPTHAAAPEGTSSDLLSRIHLGLDAELINDEGLWYAFNRNPIEVCFETHKPGSGGTIIFQGRGDRYNALIEMIKATVTALPTEGERTFLQDVWIERLISAAELQGAKVPAKRNLVALDTSDSEVQAACGKRARTLSHELFKPENDRSDDPEVELVEARPQKPLQKRKSASTLQQMYSRYRQIRNREYNGNLLSMT
ncbi:hypothetical protein HD554DRAFT_2171065 [Boletus coccyginus]|nr:hypothetical protein HD554DRAFT_2171065 [Boletus coccyginus]